MTQQISYL